MCGLLSISLLKCVFQDVIHNKQQHPFSLLCRVKMSKVTRELMTFDTASAYCKMQTRCVSNFLT